MFTSFCRSWFIHPLPSFSAGAGSRELRGRNQVVELSVVDGQDVFIPFFLHPPSFPSLNQKSETCYKSGVLQNCPVSVVLCGSSLVNSRNMDNEYWHEMRHQLWLHHPHSPAGWTSHWALSLSKNYFFFWQFCLRLVNIMFLASLMFPFKTCWCLANNLNLWDTVLAYRKVYLIEVSTATSTVSLQSPQRTEHTNFTAVAATIMLHLSPLCCCTSPTDFHQVPSIFMTSPEHFFLYAWQIWNMMLSKIVFHQSQCGCFLLSVAVTSLSAPSNKTLSWIESNIWWQTGSGII